MELQQSIIKHVQLAVHELFQASLERVELQATRREFEGQVTVVVFPMLKVIKGNPAQIGDQIGKFLVQNVEEVSDYNVVKGFLNLVNQSIQ